MRALAVAACLLLFPSLIGGAGPWPAQAPQCSTRASEILSLIAEGIPIYCDGVDIAGDLDLLTLAGPGEAVVLIQPQVEIVHSVLKGSLIADDGTRTVEFMDSVYFDGTTFKGEVNFSGARFDGFARFVGAQFASGATFLGTTFGEGANFDSATFALDAGFSGAEFGPGSSFRGAEFGGQAFYFGAVFNSGADFSGVMCRLCVFTQSRFSEDALFIEAEFTATTMFQGAEFGGQAIFYKARFNEVDFSSAQFLGDADFSQVACQSCKFTHSRFVTRARFVGAGFTSTAVFQRVEFGNEAIFDQARFEDRADFSSAKFVKSAGFKGVMFAKQADFSNAQFLEVIDLTGVEFRPRSLNLKGTHYAELITPVDFSFDALADEARNDFTVLRLLEDNFRVRQELALASEAAYLKHVTRRQSKPLPGRVVDYLFDLSFGFLLKPWRAVVSCLTVIVVFAFIYYPAGVIAEPETLADPKPRERKLSLRLGEPPLERKGDFLNEHGEPVDLTPIFRLPPGLRRVWQAFAFSFGVFTKISFGTTLVARRRRRWVVAEWVLGLVMLALLAVTLSNTNPFLNVLFGSLLF